MKRMQKVLSVLLALCLVLSAAGVFAAAEAAPVDKTLSFRRDGTFKIMQVADMQDKNDDSWKQITPDYLSEMIDAYHPDLIVLTGDNNGSNCGDAENVLKTIERFMTMFESKGVPVASVFGNHDDETEGAEKEALLAKYMEYSCFIGCPGEKMTGVGNYNLPILSSDKSHVAFNIWCFDSGTYAKGENYNVQDGYAAVQTDQIEWYQRTAAKLKEENGGQVVHSIAFQHIIPYEIYDALVPADKNTAGAFTFDKGKTYYTFPEGSAPGCEIHESPCPPHRENNKGQFAAMQEMGDVLAIAVGHDHINSYQVPYQGIDLICTASAGFRSYGNHLRGVRLFTLNESDTSTYETQVIRYLDFYAKDPVARARYKVYAPESSALVKGFYYIVYTVLHGVRTLVNRVKAAIPTPIAHR